MKYYCLYLLLVISRVGYTQWQEDFSLPDALSFYPNIDSNNYIINANEQLQLNASGAGISQLQFPLLNGGMPWEMNCFVRQNFSGSANNWGRLALTTTPILDSGVYNVSTGATGLIIQMGSPGSNDQIELYWDNGTTMSLLGSGFNIASGLYGHLKLQLDSVLKLDFQDNDSAAFSCLYLNDTLMTFQPQFLTLQSNYTASNGHNFYWDEFYFGPPLTAVTPDSFSFRSVVINELMVDPTPVVGCPETEYVELYNATVDTLFMQGWTWVNTTTVQTLPDLVLPPFSFALLVDVQDIFQWNIPVVGIPNFLSLTNTADSLTLLDGTGHVIDWIKYNAEYYHGEIIAGGIALEQIDPSSLCSGMNNWRPSRHPNGGTPGSPNSVLDHQHQENPVTLLDWGIDTLGRLFLWPSIPLTQDSVIVQINNQYFQWPMLCYHDSSIVDVPNELSPAVMYLESLSVCHQMQNTSIQIPWSMPKDTAVECWIQEILFHPKEGCPTFVEIYNPHDFSLSLDQWSIGNNKDSNKAIQNHHHFIPPHGILAISESPQKLKSFFPNSNASSAQFHSCLDLPYFTQSEGSITLYHGSNQMDIIQYSEDMHNPQLSTFQGKTLEKIIPSSKQSLWATASSNAGYGTPGLSNSQQFTAEENTNAWTLNPACFSPNGDGHQDFIRIEWHNAPPQEWIQWFITDEWGNPIFKSQPEWWGNVRQWVWDGKNQDGELCPPGLYAWTVYSSAQGHQILPTLKSFVLSP
ncbi:MAG: hypothetical protein FJX95_03505 [Bacteroidetes bacterium]|nr:hypothetical protein [Bacteroidota bacterium]